MKWNCREAPQVCKMSSSDGISEKAFFARSHKSQEMVEGLNMAVVTNQRPVQKRTRRVQVIGSSLANSA